MCFLGEKCYIPFSFIGGVENDAKSETSFHDLIGFGFPMAAMEMMHSHLSFLPPKATIADLRSFFFEKLGGIWHKKTHFSEFFLI